MGKFKVGDTVRCVSIETVSKNISHGYVAGKEFIVDEIREFPGWGNIYFPKNYHGVYECDLELVKELVKTLLKSFACTNTNQELWDKYIDWLNWEFNTDIEGVKGDIPGYFYGVNLNGKFDFSAYLTRFDTILSLEEWDEIVNSKQIKEEVMEKTHTVTRAQLKEIWDVACTAWKDTIVKYANKSAFNDTIELTDNEVYTMFKAATLDQTPVLESIFGKQSKNIDLSTWMRKGNIFVNNSTSFHNALMCIRAGGEFKNNAFILNSDYNWDLVKEPDGYMCLVPTRK
jgi:hypothetical protein